MKGVILVGGDGSRLFPLTKITNKHLLPVGRYPMIYYPINKLVEAGIKEIIIISGTSHMGSFLNLLGSGSQFGCSFTYKIQDEAGGIADALKLAENFVNKEKFVCILGDNIFHMNINKIVDSYKNQDEGAKILIKEVTDPERFGIAEIKGNKLVSIEEKPKKPKSNHCVTGIYMYDFQVFNFINTLKPSKRNELEISDVNNLYIKESLLTYDYLKDWWTDAGTFDSLLKAGSLAKDTELLFLSGK